MKKILLLLLFLCPIAASAQDVIVKKDGSTIVSKVLEITSTEVKYKKFTNQNGPTYTIAKTELQAINYENGEKETFTETSGYQIPAAVSTQQSVNDAALLKMAGVKDHDLVKAKRLRIAGWVVGGTLVAGGLVMACLTIPTEEYYGYGWYDEWNTYLETSIGVGVGVPMMAIGIATTTACLVRAKKLSNQSRYSVSTAPLYQQDFHFNNGSSLSAGVDMLKDSRINNQTLGLGLRYNF